MPPSIARRRHKHQFHSAKGPYLAACASTSTTVVHAPARPVVSSPPALRAARTTQAARAMLRVPILPLSVRTYLSNCDAALRDSVVGGFTHGFRIPPTIQHPTAHTYDNHASAFDHSTCVRRWCIGLSFSFSAGDGYGH